MEIINDFLSNNYTIFAIVSGILLLAIIGYFIESKKEKQQFTKEDESKTINIQEQVNQMYDNGTSTIQDAQNLGTMSTNEYQEESQPVQTTETQTAQEVQTQTTQPEQNNDGNIEILG